MIEYSIRMWTLRHKHYGFVLGRYCYAPQDRGYMTRPMFATRKQAREARSRLESYRKHAKVVSANVFFKVRDGE